MEIDRSTKTPCRKSICKQLLIEGQVQPFVEFFGLSHGQEYPCDDEELKTNEEPARFEMPPELFEDVQGKLVAAEKAKRTGNTSSYFSITHGIAEYFEKNHLARNTEAAAYFYQRCLKICKQRRDATGEMSAYHNLGCLYKQSGKLIRSIQFHERHMKLARDVDLEAEKYKAARELAGAYVNFGEKQQSIGAYKNAIQFYLRGIESARAIKDRDSECKTCEKLSLAYLSVGDKSMSKLFLKEYQQLRGALDNMQQQERGNAQKDLGRSIIEGSRNAKRP